MSAAVALVALTACGTDVAATAPAAPAATATPAASEATAKDATYVVPNVVGMTESAHTSSRPKQFTALTTVWRETCTCLGHMSTGDRIDPNAVVSEQTPTAGTTVVVTKALHLVVTSLKPVVQAPVPTPTAAPAAPAPQAPAPVKPPAASEDEAVGLRLCPCAGGTHP